MKENRYFIIYKPFGTICQFSKEGDHPTLKELGEFPIDIYSVGRLDTDSEGLLIITNDNFLKTRLTDPKFEHKKTYWVQVEGDLNTEAINNLKQGVEISIKGKKHHTRKASASLVNVDEASLLPNREPPIRHRQNIPTSWLQLTISEGKNRQVRRMTAKVGYPTLRLIRKKIEQIDLGGMKPGDIKEVDKEWIYKKTNLNRSISKTTLRRHKRRGI